MNAVGSAAVKHLPVSPVMRDYLVRSSTPLDEVTASLTARTAELGDAAGMAVPAEQTLLLTMLARMLGATRVIDVGTFTGLSALALARGLAPGGHVLTCDVTERYAALAREHWDRAGVGDRIEFRRTSAVKLLRGLPSDTRVDMVFIDADKLNYPEYHRLVVPLLRPGGLLLADNVLLDGYVIDPDLADAPLLRSSARALRGFNAAVAADERLDVVMLPIADGLTVARRR